MATQAPRGWPLYLLGVVCLSVALIAVKEAVSWYGHPIAGTFVDAGGVVSGVGMPGWDGKRKGLVFPNTILAVDGKVLTAEVRPRARVWDEAVADAWRAHRYSVEATVQTSAGVRTVRLQVHPIEPEAWWIYAGALFLAGALYIGAALIALMASPAGALARTFCKAGLFTGLFLLSMFDFHTTRKLAPVFFVTYAMFPLSWVILALRLPDDAPVLRRAPRLERVTDAIGIAIAGSFLGLYVTGHSTTLLQQIWSAVHGGSFLFFVIVFVARFFLADGLRRARLRALMAAVVPPHAAMGAMIFFGVLGGHNRTVGLISSAAFSLGPLSIAYAFIRHDLWGSRALLSRILTRTAVGAVACVLALGLAAASATRLGIGFEGAFLAAAFGAALAGVLLPVTLGLVDRHVFPSRAKYKPTVEQLSEELILITSPAEVARAVERTIKRWLPCELVELSLAEAPSAPTDSSSGVRTLDSPTHGLESSRPEQFTFRIEFGGVVLGSLRIGQKAGGALFTSDDLDLLRTIANQGALALAHAYAYKELEERRRQQAAAWRGERAALIETVAAELAHEIRYPINFFRNVFDGAAGGRPLDPEDLDIGKEEVDRLDRLVSGLRRMAAGRLDRQLIRVTDLCDRVETLLRDVLGERRLERAIPADARVRCDPDQATQVLANLVTNGLQAAGEGGRVGVVCSLKPKGAELAVWDTGPGFEGDPAGLFAPWYTTKPNGTGLGLAITHRLVRGHGWTIAAARRDSRTLFVISIPAEDVVVGSDEASAEKSAEVA